MHDAVKIAGISGVCAALLLGGVYVGMSYLGAFHGEGLECLNEGQIFSAVCFRVLGSYGAALIAFTVFIACFVTAVSLAAVVTDYVRRDIFRERITYVQSLLIVLTICAFFSYFGLSAILKYSIPVIVASYPLFIVLTICNGLYKLCGFKYVKLPVAITAVISFGSALMTYLS